MTVASTSTKEFTVNELVRLGYRRASILELGQALVDPEATAGREELQIIVHELEAEGLYVRCLETTVVQLTANVFSYLLTSGAIGVQGDAMYIPANETDVTKASSETRVVLIPLERWHQLSTKAATETPTYFAEKRVGSLVEILIWPIPFEAGRVRVPVWRKLADVTDGEATVDLERQWASYLVLRLATNLALNAGFDQKASQLDSFARSMLPNLKRFDGHHSPQQAYLNHPTGWDR